MPTPQEENEKLLKIDMASYEMYEKTKRDTAEFMRSKEIKETHERMYTDEQIEEQIKLIENAQKSVYDDFVARGGNPDDLYKGDKKKRKSRTGKRIQDEISASMLNISGATASAPVTTTTRVPDVDKATESLMNKDVEYIPKKSSFDSHETFDMIPLPSKGEAYRTKTSKVPVSYLTAYDENMIIAPNLYRDKLIIDTMLEQKVMSDEVAPADMLEGDREAIILFLRASGYGNEYPITATDDITGVEFETTVDLSEIKYKPFNLKGDANGYFEFELPLSKDVIKFRFLSHQNNLDLQKFEQMENEVLKKARLAYFASEIEDFIETDEVLDKTEKLKVKEAIRTIDNWAEKIDEEELLYTHSVTNRLEMSIMSVNGVTDRDFIKRYVRNMNVRDSSALRKYISDNEPGLDYNITIHKPESLGGGSMPAFLQLDQLIFLNIAG